MIFLLAVWIANAQEKYTELIIGTWEFDKTCDLRTDAEKNEFEEITWCPPYTENGTGYPTRTLKNNGDYVDFFTSEHIEYGKWEIKN